MAKDVNIKFPPLHKIFNDKFLPLLENDSRYLILKGGGGSGKSVFAAQKIIMRMLKEPGHRILVVRKVAKTIRESVFMELRQVITKWGVQGLFKIPKGNSSDMYIQCLNGNEILFAGLDDVEKLKSISGITGIWMEECSEMDPEDFRQLDIRLRGKTKHYKQIIISFNPVSVTHWLKTEFFDNVKKNSTISETTYRDNRFLDSSAIAVLEEFKQTDPYYYMVYCLGEWGVLGKTIFDAEKVTRRLSEIRSLSPLKEGFFIYSLVGEQIIDSSIQWTNEPGGYIRIYKEPNEGFPYVIGGDTSGEGSDWFTGQVLDNTTGEQVATLKQQFDEDLYAKQMYCLGKYYNDALLSIEVNFSTYPVKELQRLGYPNQFVRESEDTFTKKLKKSYGFVTSSLTRRPAISGLVVVVRENVDLINDVDTLEEMLTFVRNERGKEEAQQGKHDDLIMALAIAHYCRGQQRYVSEVMKSAPVEKLIDKLQPKKIEDWLI